MTLHEKLQYVDQVFDFLFHGTFASKFHEIGVVQGGSDLFDPEFWYVNAVVFSGLATARPPSEAQRMPLFTLIETLHFHARMPHNDGWIDFDVSHNDFADDILYYKQDAIKGILREMSSQRASPARTGVAVE